MIFLILVRWHDVGLNRVHAYWRLHLLVHRVAGHGVALSVHAAKLIEVVGFDARHLSVLTGELSRAHFQTVGEEFRAVEVERPGDQVGVHTACDQFHFLP